MTNCLLCNQPLNATLSLSFIFSFKKVQENQLCEKCFENFETIDPQSQKEHKALYCFNDIAQEFMDRYTKQGDLLLAEALSQQVFDALSPYQKTHLIVTIPPSRQNQKRQGFDSVALLVEKAGISYHSLFKRKQNEALQWIEPNIPQKMKKSKVLIVDDIYKTGYTILQAKALIKENLDASMTVHSFTFFYLMKDESQLNDKDGN